MQREAPTEIYFGEAIKSMASSSTEGFLWRGRTPVVSSGYRVPRMPPVSQDAKPRLQAAVVSSTSPYTEVRGQSREVSRVHVFTHIVCPVFIAVTLALRPSHTLKLIHPRTHLHLRPSHTQERHMLSVLAPRPSPSPQPRRGPVSVWVQSAHRDILRGGSRTTACTPQET